MSNINIFNRTKSSHDISPSWKEGKMLRFDQIDKLEIIYSRHISILYENKQQQFEIIYYLFITSLTFKVRQQ